MALVSKLALAFVFAFRLLLSERLPPSLAGPDSVGACLQMHACGRRFSAVEVRRVPVISIGAASSGCRPRTWREDDGRLFQSPV
jgi:hypothetical protein